MNSKSVFERFVPAAAVEYCDKLYSQLGFEFKIKKSRQTKLGDFRFDPRSQKATITINNDLNPYAFLITYLHEVAHHLTFKEFKGRVKPHGGEWKNCFKNITSPVLNEQTFPPNVLLSLKNYFKNPKASSCSDPILFKVLKQYDTKERGTTIDELEPNATFRFRSKIYQKQTKKRTRWTCQELNSGRIYLIPGVAEVELIDK